MNILFQIKYNNIRFKFKNKCLLYNGANYLLLKIFLLWANILKKTSCNKQVATGGLIRPDKTVKEIYENF
jgi:hypothetical protein